MSVGTEMISQPLQLAVNNTVSLYNLSIVAAAGNAATDSCMNTPSRSVYVTSVGAADITDKISKFSNNGKCVNVYAPGTLIYCANLNSTYRVISGTSMSCPIVSRIVGQYLEYNSSLTTWGITDVLYKSRSRGSQPNRSPPIITVPTSSLLLLALGLHTTLHTATLLWCNLCAYNTSMRRFECKMLRYFGRCVCGTVDSPKASVAAPRTPPPREIRDEWPIRAAG